MSAPPHVPLVMVANRGEIALRLVRGVQALGLRALAVYDAVDQDLPFVGRADISVALSDEKGVPYMDVDQLVDVARTAGVAAVHPGYGFLSEKPGFADAVVQAGIAWVGPDAAAITAMGDKVRSKQLMAKSGVPVVPGSVAPVPDVEGAVSAASETGYPVMVKSSAGGGGMGMVIARDEEELRAQFEQAQTRAGRLFGDPTMLLERYVEHARHIEIQIFGLADGTIIALGERDCSVQRRHQKVVEEAPSPFVDDDLRRRLSDAAVRAGAAIAYRGAGTVEFVVDATTGEFFFLEMNTRLQVEHPVTECVTGVDLVAEQPRLALDRPTVFGSGNAELTGHAIELRVYAEDPIRFFPSPGQITVWHEPAIEGVRIDAGYVAGNTVSRKYDPLLAKIVAHGPDRSAAIALAIRAVAEFKIEGVQTNLPFLARLLVDPQFVAGKYDTSLISVMSSKKDKAKEGSLT